MIAGSLPYPKDNGNESRAKDPTESNAYRIQTSKFIKLNLMGIMYAHCNKSH